MKRLAALLLAAGLLAGACGGDSGPDPEADPKGALVSAFEKLTQSEGIAMEISFDATPESLNALGGEGSEEMSEEDAEKLLDSSLSVLSKGKGDDAQFEMVVTIAGEEDVTIKMVEKVLYFQVDVEGIAETFGADSSEFEAAARQAEAAGMTFVRPALNGEWIAVTGAEELSKQFGGGATEDMEASQQQFIQDMTEALKDTAEVTTEGEDDAGTRLAVSVPIRDIYSRLTSALQQNPATAAVPFAQLPPESEIPDESVVLDVWVEDDEVTQVAFDLAQVAALEGEGGGTGGRAALLIELDEFDDDVEVPDDAVEVSAQQLFQMFGGAMMGGMGGSSGSGSMMPPGGGGGFDCDQLKGAPPSILEQFAEECPELQNN